MSKSKPSVARSKSAARRDDLHIKYRSRLRHVMKIDQEIRSNCAPNCQRLAGLLEVSRRTILRDIDFLKYDMGAPIAFDPIRGGYVYTKPGWNLPSMKVDTGDLIAFMVAQQALAAYAGTPWAAKLAAFFERVTAAIPGRIDLALRMISMDRIGDSDYRRAKFL